MLCFNCLSVVLLLLMFCDFLMVPWVGLQCVAVVFPDHTFRTYTIWECQNVWTLIKPSILSGPICVQYVYNGYLQMALADKELKVPFLCKI